MNRGIDALVVAGAAGAAVHAVLAPEHLREWAPLGASFAAGAAVLAVGVVALALRPSDRRVAGAVASVLAVFVAGYVTTRLTALPPLDPDRLPEFVHAWELRYVDFHIGRGVFVPMTDAELDAITGG